jgi:prepilin signal peptidase PulO-like enzyme (type II secretory pathway)
MELFIIIFIIATLYAISFFGGNEFISFSAYFVTGLILLMIDFDTNSFIICLLLMTVPMINILNKLKAKKYDIKY